MKPYKDAIVKGILVLSVMLLAALLWRHPYVLTAIVIIVCLFTIRGKEDFHLFAVMVCLTAIGEPIAVHLGAWQYGAGNYFGVPYWIPIFWGLIGVSIKDLVIAIEHWHT